MLFHDSGEDFNVSQGFSVRVEVESTPSFDMMVSRSDGFLKKYLHTRGRRLGSRSV